jgi:hypothetical protein
MGEVQEQEKQVKPVGINRCIIYTVTMIGTTLLLFILSGGRVDRILLILCFFFLFGKEVCIAIWLSRHIVSYKGYDVPV